MVFRIYCFLRGFVEAGTIYLRNEIENKNLPLKDNLYIQYLSFQHNKMQVGVIWKMKNSLRFIKIKKFHKDLLSYYIFTAFLSQI